MATHIRRFVTSPQPIFESEFPFGTRTPLSLIAAAKCLVLCIEVSEGEISLDVVISSGSVPFSSRLETMLCFLTRTRS